MKVWKFTVGWIRSLGKEYGFETNRFMAEGLTLEKWRELHEELRMLSSNTDENPREYPKLVTDLKRTIKFSLIYYYFVKIPFLILVVLFFILIFLLLTNGLTVANLDHIFPRRILCEIGIPSKTDTILRFGSYLSGQKQIVECILPMNPYYM